MRKIEWTRENVEDNIGDAWVEAYSFKRYGTQIFIMRISDFESRKDFECMAYWVEQKLNEDIDAIMRAELTD